MGGDDTLTVVVVNVQEAEQHHGYSFPTSGGANLCDRRLVPATVSLKGRWHQSSSSGSLSCQGPGGLVLGATSLASQDPRVVVVPAPHNTWSSVGEWHGWTDSFRVPLC